MRMLSPDVDPGIKAFIAVVRAAEHQSEKAADQGKTHWAKNLRDEPVTVAGFFMPAWRVLREIVCRISGCKSTEFAQRHGREGIKLMGQKFFDIHESSRFNMSFKCSGEFNIIYIMRTIMAEGEKQPPSVNQSYNQRPALADAMSIPIVKSAT